MVNFVGRHVPRKSRPSGRDQGAQYKRKLPYREAPPFRAGSFISCHCEERLPAVGRK